MEAINASSRVVTTTMRMSSAPAASVARMEVIAATCEEKGEEEVGKCRKKKRFKLSIDLNSRVCLCLLSH